MGKQKDSALRLIVVTENTLAVVLKRDFVDDEDFNGNNGEEYVSEKAKKKGFTSDKDFAYAQAISKTKNMKGEKKVKTFIDIIIKALKENGGSFYTNVEYKMQKIGGIYAIAVMSETEC